MFSRLPSLLVKKTTATAAATAAAAAAPQLLQRRTLSSTLTRLNNNTNDDSKKSKPKSDTAVNFRNFISLGIISSLILVQVVDSVNDANTGNKNVGRSMSEAEYARQQARLKRKKAAFDEDELDVKFLWSDKGVPQDLKVEGYEVISPLALIEEEKQNKESRFYDLLNDPSFKIPRGLVNDLVKNKLLAESQSQKKFIVVLDDKLEYDLKDFIQFEDKVKIINNLIVLNSETLHDAQRYYQTVKKVVKIDSLDDLEQNI